MMRSKLTRLHGVLALVVAALGLGLGWKTETAGAFVVSSACDGSGGGHSALVLPPHHHTAPGAFVSSRFGGVVIRFARDGAKGDDESIPRGEGGRDDDEEFYESLRTRMGQLGDDEGSRRSTDDDGRTSPEFGPGGLERDRQPKSDDKTSDKSWLRPPQLQPISRLRPSLFSPDDGGGAEGEGDGRSNSTPRERMMRTESNLVSRATSGTTIALQAAVTLSFLAFQVFVFATGGISDGSDRFPDESAYMLTDKEVQALERVDDGSGPWSGRGGGDVVERNLDNDADGPIVL